MVRSSGIQRQFKWTYSAYQVDFNGRSDRLWLIHVYVTCVSFQLFYSVVLGNAGGPPVHISGLPVHIKWTSRFYKQLRWTSTAYQVDSRAAEVDHNGNLMDFQRSSSNQMYFDGRQGELRGWLKSTPVHIKWTLDTSREIQMDFNGRQLRLHGQLK
uniref:Uncharacterized protein n=1 Tax=Ditylenchus dipsaci TaxID=166011 RepID=A0A915DLG7_9BILA